MTTRAKEFADYAEDAYAMSDNMGTIAAALVSIAISLERIERLIDARENGA